MRAHSWVFPTRANCVPRPLPAPLLAPVPGARAGDAHTSKHISVPHQKASPPVLQGIPLAILLHVCALYSACPKAKPFLPREHSCLRMRCSSMHSTHPPAIRHSMLAGLFFLQDGRRCLARCPKRCLQAQGARVHRMLMLANRRQLRMGTCACGLCTHGGIRITRPTCKSSCTELKKWMGLAPRALIESAGKAWKRCTRQCRSKQVALGAWYPPPQKKHTRAHGCAHAHTRTRTA